MPSHRVELAELANRFQEVLALAAAGDEVLVTVDGVPNAQLRYVPPPRTEPRIPNLHPGAFQPADDFDAPLPDEFWLGKS